MKNLMIPALALFLSAAAQADDSPLWMRYCAISRTGRRSHFLTKGISTRSLLPGGKARQLTTHLAMIPVRSGRPTDRE